MDSKDWQELMQQLLLDVQNTNKKQLEMLGELKADIKAIKQKLQDHDETLGRHEAEIGKLKQVQERHKTYFKIISGVVAAATMLFSTIVGFFKIVKL